MTRTMGFGASNGSVMQMAYVVEDIQASIRWWSESANTGPWFLLDHFLGEGQFYRGAPSTADAAIAMSFAGSMCIELIQPLDSNPSVYKELIDRRGYGFHHIGIASDDVERDIATYAGKGYDLAFQAAVPTGGSVAYLDDGRNDPGYLELIPMTDGMDAVFTKYWRAAQSWDGTDLVRPFG